MHDGQSEYNSSLLLAGGEDEAERLHKTRL